MLDALGSVSGNQVQQNPLQPDLQYRGFLASPLLGAPQGLSVYIDGVRLNEPFGDTLSWDLIPTEAIRSANLMPGSNPLYGLNTLGGALSLETKTGFSDPGAEVHLLGGSFGRRLLDVGIGGHGQRWGVFAAGRYFGEEGWRPFSPSRTASAFVATTYRNGGDVGGAGAHRGGHDADRQRPGAAPAARARSPRDLHAPRSHRQPHVHGDRARRAPAGGVRAPVGRRVLPRQPHRDGQRRSGRLDRLPGSRAGRLRLHQRRRRRRDAGARRRRQPDPVRSAATPTTRPRTRRARASRATASPPRSPSTAPLAGRENHLFVGAAANEGRAGFTSSSALARLSQNRGTVSERHRRRRIARRGRQRDAATWACTRPTRSRCAATCS